MTSFVRPFLRILLAAALLASGTPAQANWFESIKNVCLSLFGSSAKAIEATPDDFGTSELTVANAWQFGKGLASWRAYEQYSSNQWFEKARKPLLQLEVEVPASDYPVKEWISLLDKYMGDRDSWVKWNIYMAQLIRKRRAEGGASMFVAMIEVLQESGVRGGFGSDILVLRNNDQLNDVEWARMQSQGKLFIDPYFRDRNRASGRNRTEIHTEIVHCLHLLYVQYRLEQDGYPSGETVRIMKGLFGNLDLIAKLKYRDPADGMIYESNRSYITKDFRRILTLRPWTIFFDGSIPCNPSRPEWFGEISHIVAPDVPYEEISAAMLPNWPPRK